jgi:Spy/CpxP family protein refolding chaperone
MSRRFYIVVTVVLVVGLIASSQALAARKAHRPGKGLGFLALSEELGLSDEQKSKIESIKYRSEKRAISKKAELETANLDLRELLKADAPDRTAIRNKVNEISKLRAELKMIHIDGMLDSKAVLSPQQLEDMKRLKQEAAHKKLKHMHKCSEEKKQMMERPHAR